MRDILWLKAAQKTFDTFPMEVRDKISTALESAARGQLADAAKPLKGFDGGVYEIAIAYRKDAYRTVYAVKIGADIWVIHAFQKKSKQGIKTPQHEIDVLHERLRRLKAAWK
jgi:phage-related protein